MLPPHNQQQLHVNDSLQQHHHEAPAIAAEAIDDELVEAGLAEYSDHELEESESDYEDNATRLNASLRPCCCHRRRWTLTTATMRWIACR